LLQEAQRPDSLNKDLRNVQLEDLVLSAQAKFVDESSDDWRYREKIG